MNSVHPAIKMETRAQNVKNKEETAANYTIVKILTCRTCLNCSSKLQPLFCCDELDASLALDEFDSRLP